MVAGSAASDQRIAEQFFLKERKKTASEKYWSSRRLSSQRPKNCGAILSEGEKENSVREILE
jgi:hypothetical protein